MAPEGKPDESSEAIKQAMHLNGQRSGSCPSISSSVSTSDSCGETSTPESFPTRFALGNHRRSAFENPFPLIHSTGRAVLQLKTNPSQPDLINHHAEVPRQQGSFLDDQSKLTGYGIIPSLADSDCSVSISTVQLKPPPAVISPKPNIPGTSVIVTESGSSQSLCSSSASVVEMEKLQRYPPGLITIEKEGPLETPSLLFLASVEKEMKALKTYELHTNISSMGPEEESSLNTSDHCLDKTEGCECRLVLENRLRSAIEKCCELQEQVELSDSKCNRWEEEAVKSGEEASQMRLKVLELEAELSARTASLHGLKAKVAEQYVECDELRETMRKIERDSKAHFTQLDSIKKSEEFYRKQLHFAQVERSSLQKQLMTAETNRLQEKHRAEKLQSELKQTQEHFLELERKALREKQSFTRQLEKVLVVSSSYSPSSDDFKISQKNEDDSAVSQLQQHISDLQVSLKASHSNQAASNVEIGRLMARNVQLQGELSSTKIKLQEEQDLHASAARDRDKAEEELKQREQALSELSQESAVQAAKLDALLRERDELQQQVTSVTRNFTNVSSQYRAMKAECEQLRKQSEAWRDTERDLRAERDSLGARLEEGGRREQAALMQLQLLQQQARECGQLEHQVLALQESRAKAQDAQQAAERRLADLEPRAAACDDLAKRNEQLQNKVESLSQLLQENTGSRVKVAEDGPGPGPADEDVKAQLAQLAQLQSENGHLHAQVQRSSARLLELTNTIQELETEMASLKAIEVGPGSAGPVGQGDGVEQLRHQNAELQRAKHELSQQVEQLNLWLDMMTQAQRLGSRDVLLKRLSTTPVQVEESPSISASDQLTTLQDANRALTLYAAALQRRLEHVDGADGDRPDLLSSSERQDVDKGVGEEDADDVRCLLALLRVCLGRARALVGDADDDDERRDGHDGRDAIHRCLERLTASVELVAAVRHPGTTPDRREQLVLDLLAKLKEHVLARRAVEAKLARLQEEASRVVSGPAAGDGAAGGIGPEVAGRIASLEQELASAHANVTQLHKQLFNEKRDASQLRKEVASLRMGLDTANDMLDNNKIALGRSEAYGQVLKVSMEQLQARFEKEQCEHEDCRVQLERLTEQLQEARAKDPLLESQLKTLGCHLHQRAGEVRALEESLSLRDRQVADLCSQLERQKVTARKEYEALRYELTQTQQEFSNTLLKMNSSIPEPIPCDEEGLTSLIQESNRLSPKVLHDLKILLHNLKAELEAVEHDVGYSLISCSTVVQHV